MMQRIRSPLAGGELFREPRRRIKAHSTIPKIERFYTPRLIQNPWQGSQHPGHKSGFHYNSHLRHQRVWMTSRVVDHMSWGRDLGQATNVHRNQRTAFDANDTVHPTHLPDYAEPKFANQDPTAGPHPDLSRSHNPHTLPFNSVLHYRTLYRPGPNGADISFPSDWKHYQHKLGLDSMSSVGNHAAFGLGDIPPSFLTGSNLKGVVETAMDQKSVAVPGIDMPYFGEPDRMNMESMAVALNKNNTVCSNSGRFSTSLYLNTPAKGNVMDTATATSLAREIDRHTNGILSKLTFFKAAQSGLTDRFCGGLDVQGLASAMAARAHLLQKLQSEKKAVVKKTTTKIPVRSFQAEQDYQNAQRQLANADRHLRSMTTLLWKAFSANRPLMTFINGACHNVGIGLALLPKYAVLRDSTEFVSDGPNMGLTPFGCGTHFFSRQETTTKYPGLAEFALLTCAPIYSGDALRLGWSDLFTTLPDVDYHVREWFDNTEHMHNDAVAWQLGYLLDTTFRINPATHSVEMERVAVTKERARWIAETFADQDSVEGIVRSLSMVEALPLSDPQNTMDRNMTNPFTTDVQSAAAELQKSRLSYTLAPWELTPLPADLPITPKPLGDVFNKFYFERNIADGYNGTTLRDPNLEKWKDFRYGEYAAFKNAQLSDLKRHVYVKIEGLDSKVASFDFAFDFRDVSQRDSVLKDLTAAARKALGLAPARDVTLGWCLPTCDAARVRHDEELLTALIHDPGYEDSTKMLAHPPIYFVLHRTSISFSEWAYSVNHLLLSHCPFALKASLRLLKEIRGDLSGKPCASVSATLAIERRVMIRMLQRSDFYKVGCHTANRSPAELEKEAEKASKMVGSQGVAPSTVFEEGRTLHGHKFTSRPRWSPATLEDVKDADVEAVFAPLRFEDDGLCEIDVPSEAYHRQKSIQSMEDAGIQLTSRLGTPDCPNEQSDARVPDNVNFYEMARHPWLEHESSWRLDGYTDGSMQYLTDNYKHAEEHLYGRANEPRNYWQSSPRERLAHRRDNLPDEKPAPDVTAEALLRDNFWGVIESAETGVTDMLQDLRRKSKNGKFGYRLELASPQEKIYDDRYYQWFITPGRHPNPSMVIK